MAPDLDIDELVRLRGRTLAKWLPTGRKAAPSKGRSPHSKSSTRLLGASSKRTMKKAKKKGKPQKPPAKPAPGQKWAGWPLFQAAIEAEQKGNAKEARRLVARAEKVLTVTTQGSAGFISKTRRLLQRLDERAKTPTAPVAKPPAGPTRSKPVSKPVPSVPVVVRRRVRATFTVPLTATPNDKATTRGGKP